MKQLFLILMSVSFGCAAANAQELKKAAELIGCKTVDEQSYDYNKVPAADFDKWKKDELKVDSQMSFAAKCRAKDGLRYTFWFEEETYADEANAKARMLNLRALPPQLKKEFEDCDGKTLSEYLFRDAFRRGTKVYLVSSKAFKLALENDIERISKKLESKIK